VAPDHIINRLKGIRDARMRVLALVAAFGEGSPTSWVEAMIGVLTRAQRLDDVDSLLVLECITHAARDETLAYTTRQALYEAAIERGMPAIARLFLASSPTTTVPPQLAKQLGPERRLIPTGRLLTLGERKSLARTHHREKLGKMIADPHPAVVAILLENPHLTELDVVRMAAMRPGVPDALAKIAGHPKWSVRHAIKRALVLNPSTPLADAIRIATTLRAAELAELAADASLPEPLRLHAAELRAVTSALGRRG
jgi:hypothetical protein